MDIIVDTISFRANFESDAELFDFLCIFPDVFESFEKSDKKFNFNYSYSYFYQGIRIGFDGEAGWGYYIHMSGRGCRTYEDIRGSGFSWFSFISDLCNMIDMRTAAITRIDLACDECDGIFNIKRLEKYIENDMYLSRCKKTSIRLIKFGEECLYVGSPQSLALLRIYNKKLERGFDESDEEVPHWWRCEFQLRDEHATQVVREWVKLGDVGKVYSGHVLQHIRFITHSNLKDGTQCRYQTARWWSEFLDKSDAIKWVSNKGSNYNLTKLERYAIGNAGSSVKTLIQAKKLTADELYGLYMNPNVKLREDQKAFIAYHNKLLESGAKDEFPSYERVCQCEKCGKVASSDEFIYYVGSVGICRSCS